MPHPRILKVLGMTAEAWGKLPPEVGTIGATFCTNDRAELRQKALAIIAREEAVAAARALIAKADELEIARKLVAEADAESGASQ